MNSVKAKEIFRNRHTDRKTFLYSFSQFKKVTFYFSLSLSGDRPGVHSALGPDHRLQQCHQDRQVCTLLHYGPYSTDPFPIFVRPDILFINVVHLNMLKSGLAYPICKKVGIHIIQFFTIVFWLGFFSCQPCS